MLPLSHRIAFAIFAVITLTLGMRGFVRLYRRITRGRRDPEGRTDRPVQRLWYALRTTLFQERVFRRRRVLSVFHSFIFYAFTLYLVVNAVDAVEGYVNFEPLTPSWVHSLYGGLTDALSVLAIVGVLTFVVRRFFLGSRRVFAFNERTLLHEKVRRGYIQRDSVLVSAFILFHIGSRVVGNAARLALYGTDPAEPFSSALAGLFVGSHAAAWRVFGYWGALGSVLLFLAYFPYTKHIHLFAAPIKYFFHRRATSGEMPPAPINLEIAEPQIGAAYLADLSQPRLLDAYACIQCNRCQDVCPASQTGKALSPSALEINKRMVLNGITEEVSAFSLAGSAGFENGTSAGPALLEAVISPEAIWACTTCGACMEVCPTQDEQMLDILDIRRNLVMAQGEFPSTLQNAFRGMERSSNPWAISRDKRMVWAEGLHVPTIEENPDPEVLYWVGCAASYDPSAQKTARAVVQLLGEANVNFAVLGKRECCTGDSARRAGNELLYQQLAGQAVAALTEAHPKLVVASCPHCVNTISTEYPHLGGRFKVMHHTEYLASLVDEGRLKPLASESKVTFHDPCYLGRHRGTYDAPRSLLTQITKHYVELPRTKNNAFCCGAGGAQFWKEEEPGRERVSENRFREVQETLAMTQEDKVLAVGCPFCKSMLQSTPAAGDDATIAIKDVAEILWEGVARAKRGTAELGAPGTLNVPLRDPLNEAVPQYASSETAPPEEACPTVAAALTKMVDPSTTVIRNPVEGDGKTSPLRSPERRKWQPKASEANVESTAVTQPAPVESSTLSSPFEQEQTDAKATPQRKKWTPEAKSPGTVELSASERSEPPPPDSNDMNPLPARKKRQPGGPR